MAVQEDWPDPDPHRACFCRSFLLEHRDGLYLERMHDYLDDHHACSPILDQAFWLLDLPFEDSKRARDRLSQIRAEWALCAGFKMIVAFADYLALQDNKDGPARTANDICSVPLRDKSTQYLGQLCLPSKIPLG